MKPEVKDIEVVARISDWEASFEVLRQWGQFIKPGVPDIIPWAPKVGAKYLRMMLNDGVKLDLFIASEENWGALYTMRTGGATGPDGSPFEGFVPGMFSRWKKVSGGGKMSGCLPTLPDGRQVIVREEADFFRVCGIEWAPPSERTSRGAISPIKGFSLDCESLEFAA
jgi:DNA polymerase/3'-5' exonuclease PolX